jgi:prophage tail gpP-like protein
MPLDKQDTVDLRIDGQTGFGVKSYTLSTDTFKACSEFTASLNPVDVPGSLEESPMSWSLDINGVPVSGGYVDSITRSYSKGNNELTIRGRDGMQLLVDNYPQKTGNQSFSTKDIEVMLKDVCKELQSLDINQLYEFSNSDLAAYKANGVSIVKHPTINLNLSASAKELINKVGKMVSYDRNPGESYYEFLVRLVGQFGLVMYQQGGTVFDETRVIGGPAPGPTQNPIIAAGGVAFNLLVDRIKNDQGYYNRMTAHLDPQIISYAPMSENRGMNNVISCEYTQDISQWWSNIRIIGQSNGYATDEETGNEITGKVNQVDMSNTDTAYNGLRKQRTYVYNVADTSVWQGKKPGKLADPKTLLNNYRIEQNRNLNKLVYTMYGHTDNNGVLYERNSYVRVRDENMDIDATMVIYAVEYTGSRTEGMRTVVTVGPFSSDDVVNNTKHFNATTGPVKGVFK